MSRGTLANRVALVTGAGNGIGAAIAERFAAEGAAVVVHDLGVSLSGEVENGAAAGDVVDRIRASGGMAYAEASDVTDFGAVGEVVDRAVERFGRLDTVVTSAGILRDRMIFNMSPAEWDAVIAVHLKGLYNVTRHVSAHWRQDASVTDGRRLITLTSRSGLFGGASQPNYSAAKSGVVGFVYSCAKSLARYGVTSNAICPTADTRMTAAQAAATKSVVAGSQEWSPHNVATVATWLASAESAWLNGHVVGSRGYNVELYSRPEVVAAVTRQEPWSLEDLTANLVDTFRKVVERS